MPFTACDCAMLIRLKNSESEAILLFLIDNGPFQSEVGWHTGTWKFDAGNQPNNTRISRSAVKSALGSSKEISKAVIIELQNRSCSSLKRVSTWSPRQIFSTWMASMKSFVLDTAVGTQRSKVAKYFESILQIFRTLEPRKQRIGFRKAQHKTARTKI